MMSTRNAQLSKPIVFYFSNPAVYGGTGEIMMGLPEQFAAPAGFEKVVCTSTAAAEKWSARMRKWEETKEELAQMYQQYQEREQVEAIRSEFRTKIANASNQVNRDFMIQSLANFEKRYKEKYETERTSFLHIEGYADGDKSVAQPKHRQKNKLPRGLVSEF